MTQDDPPSASSPSAQAPTSGAPAPPSGKAPLSRASERAKAAEESFSHPLNPNSKIFARTLSDGAGLERIGVHLVRVPSGKEAFVYHRHRTEEEFIYVLSGRGIADIDGKEYEVGPGDFMGFGTSPPVGHHLHNPFSEDLVYLLGGERRPSEIAEYPKLGKLGVRVGMAVSVFETASAQGVGDYKKIE
ncbi:MAG TPA: cupin domain-containing protein [Polyangiaceae bacterium]|jgi:uncharacterized cupin superfamily protein|nr:cupin domain-containing protein [Polyangiaceae bacterium]